MVLFDDYELLDVYGPMELLAGSAVLPESRGKIKISFRSATGQAVKPTAPGHTRPQHIDLVYLVYDIVSEGVYDTARLL